MRTSLRAPALRRALAAPLAAAAVGLAACGGDGPAVPAVPPLARIVINQAGLDTLTEYEMRQLTVTGSDADGRPRTVRELQWQSSDSTIVAVATDGIVAARQPGSATVRASSEGVSAEFVVRVVELPVWDVAAQLVGAVSRDTLLVGSTATVVLEPRDIQGRALRGRRVTAALANATAGRLDSLGRITGHTVGRLELLARVDTVERRKAFVVRPAFAAGLSVRLTDPKRIGDALWIGLRDSAVVAFNDSAGRPLPASPFRPASFTSDNPSVATVEAATGRVTPTGAGTTMIRAAGDRLTASKAITVVAAPITTVIAAPDTVRIVPGEATQLRPALLDGAGLRVSALGARVIRYESAAPGIAAVDAQGLVRGVAAGQTTLRVTTERSTTTVPVRVVQPAGNRAFRITVRYLGPMPASEIVAAFDAAKARWEGVIRESLGWSRVDVPQGACDDDDQPFSESGDVVILARIDSIDGPSNVLGSAGPCVVRRLASGRAMPLIGRMTFDSADMRTMITSGRLGNVIAHEMGHVLGIGTLWSRFATGGTPLAVQTGSDPRYSGAAATLASVGMGFTSLSLDDAGAALLERVPLENTGGSGTAGAHWRRSVFGNELMNGFAGTGASPLSLLTVQAMADLGFVVSTSSAEPWGQFVSPVAASLGVGRSVDATATAIREVLHFPAWEMDVAGRVRRWSGNPRGPARPQ